MLNSLFIAGAADQMARNNQAQLAVESASRTAEDVRRQNESMQYDIEKLFMITEALWIILKDRHGYTDDQLAQMLQDIDLRDGKLDNKVAKQQNPSCPQCQRTLMGKHPVCLYCGTPAARDPFER